MGQVYPRVGGATSANAQLAAGVKGLSPRGRGNHTTVNLNRHHWRSIPAWAGQPGSDRAFRPYKPVYPRVGGATHPDEFREQAEEGLSPRGRGNRSHKGSYIPPAGSIPAWAGQPLVSAWTATKPTVYPRVGGATCPSRNALSLCWGLSPRGRGNQEHGSRSHIPRGSIPAWAGQPLCLCLRRQWATVYPRVGGATR